MRKLLSTCLTVVKDDELASYRAYYYYYYYYTIFITDEINVQLQFKWVWVPHAVEGL